MGTKIQIQEVEIPEGKELLEDACLLEYVFEEDASDSKKAYLKGRFGQTDVPTANRRVYPRKVMSEQFGRVADAITQRRMYGELDHPGDGKTKGSRVSHFITDLKLHESGEFTGIVEFIPGTINGDQALAIAKAGGKLGISSRGYGTTVQDSKGNHVVQEDYTLVSFDLVIDPANAGAFPDYVVEHKEGQAMDLNTLKKEHPDLAEALKEEISKELSSEARSHAREALREEFEAKLQESADEIREEALEEARAELLVDPEVAGSSTAMKEIAKHVAPFILRESEGSVISELEKRLADAEKNLAEMDAEKDKAVSEAEELAELAKEAFFHLYLEQTLHGSESREQVEAFLGDVTEFETLDDLKERVEEIVAAMNENEEVTEEYEGEISKRDAKIRQLEEELETALAVGNQFAARSYIERKLSNHPKADQVREFLNEMEPTTKEDVDRFVESFDASNPTSDEFNRIQDGLRNEDEEDKGSRRTISENTGFAVIDGGKKIFGVDMDELVKASNDPHL